MTLRQTVEQELARSPGSARELAARCELTEKQVRNAIDGLRSARGYSAVEHRPEGSFALASTMEGNARVAR
jgi:hypothetical protein